MSSIEAIEAGLAPRMAAGWMEVLALLSDGEEHTRDDCFQVITATGLAYRTAENMMRDAVDLARVRPIYSGQKFWRGHRGTTRAVRVVAAYALPVLKPVSEQLDSIVGLYAVDLS